MRIVTRKEIMQRAITVWTKWLLAIWCIYILASGTVVCSYAINNLIPAMRCTYFQRDVLWFGVLLIVSISYTLLPAICFIYHKLTLNKALSAKSLLAFEWQMILSKSFPWTEKVLFLVSVVMIAYIFTNCFPYARSEVLHSSAFYFELADDFESAERAYKNSNKRFDSSFITESRHSSDSIYGVNPDNPVFEKVIENVYGNSSVQMARRLDDIGFYFSQQKKYALAETRYEQALLLSARLGAKYRQLITLQDLVSLYIDTDRLDSAIPKLIQAEEILSGKNTEGLLHTSFYFEILAKQAKSSELERKFAKHVGRYTSLVKSNEEGGTNWFVFIPVLGVFAFLEITALIKLNSLRDHYLSRIWKRKLRVANYMESLDYLERLIVLNLVRKRFDEAHHYSQRFLGLVNTHVEKKN